MIERLISNDENNLNSNVFIVSKGDSCVIVDAGVTLERIVEAVGNKKVLGVFITHGHFDHSFFAVDYAKKFGCKIYASAYAKEYLEDPDKNYSEGALKVTNFDEYVFLGEKGIVDLSDIAVSYVQLGGHSRSDMYFKIDDDIFVGDVLIGRNMGRIDLYGADKDQMLDSLQKLIGEQYSVMHSGHGRDNDKDAQDKVANLWIKFLKR